MHVSVEMVALEGKVPCPRQNEWLDLATCRQCPDLLSIDADDSGHVMARCAPDIDTPIVVRASSNAAA
jgi:hypothetical protein